MEILSANCPVRAANRPEMQQGHPLVVGFGNELRGDDGVGQSVAEALWSRRHGVPVLGGVAFIWCAQLVPEIALDLSGASFAIFVDAAYDGRAPGSVHLSQLDEEVAPKDRVGQVAGALGCWVDLSPTALLSLSAELFGAAPPATLVTVSVDVPVMGVGLSPRARAAVPVAVRVVERAIASWHNGSEPVMRTRGRLLRA
jgi:hydrogenase maturation protease